MSFYFNEKDRRKRVRVTVRLEKDIYIHLASQDQNISETIRQALHEFVDSKDTPKQAKEGGDFDEINKN